MCRCSPPAWEQAPDRFSKLFRRVFSVAHYYPKLKDLKNFSPDQHNLLIKLNLTFMDLSRWWISAFFNLLFYEKPSIFIFFTAFYILPEKHPQIQLLSPFFFFFLFFTLSVFRLFRSWSASSPSWRGSQPLMWWWTDSTLQTSTRTNADSRRWYKCAKQHVKMRRIRSEFCGFTPSACLFHLGGVVGEFSVSCRMTNAAAHMSRPV